MRPACLAAALVACLVAAGPRVDGQAPDSEPTWEFAAGAPDEHLSSGIDRLPTIRTPVTLPHRILRPDTALWYVADLTLPAKAALEVDADDGAQVFVNGQRARRVRRSFFVDDASAATHRVVVRVLNNAMMGGLRAVRIVDASAVRVPPPTPQSPIVVVAPGTPAFAARMAGRSDTCQFSAWADSQGGWDTFAPLVDLMARQPTDFSVGIGDLVNDGSDPAQWAGFAQRLAPLAARTAIVAIPGNHDYDGYYDDLRSPTFDAWFRFGGEPTWTSWSCGPARFAAIDVNQQFPIGLGAAQAAWLEREVTSAPWRTASWRVLMVHQPPWSRSWPGYDGDRVVRDLVERLSRDAALDVVVSGHSHAYERTVRRVAGRELHAFITGGAGGGLEPASVAALDTPDWRVVVRHHVLLAEARPGTLHFRAVDAAGTTIDEVTIRR